MLDKNELEQAISEIEENPKTYNDVEKLAHFYSVYDKHFGKQEEVPTTTAETELSDIFPALGIYQREHTLINLQRLCQEISEFCAEVYASTRNEEERQIFKKYIIV